MTHETISILFNDLKGGGRMFSKNSMQELAIGKDQFIGEQSLQL